MTKYRYKKREKDWRKDNPDKVAEYRLKARFGIHLIDFEFMELDQGGKCAICGGTSKGVKLSVDHDHTSLAIRGLLCVTCNRALGLFKDNIHLLESAVKYMKKPPKIVAEEIDKNLIDKNGSKWYDTSAYRKELLRRRRMERQLEIKRLPNTK